ncbi:MAG: hypothetical protein SGI92_20910 [Bryobacteraceae bacterium]|nr:hypothetical protein [Bryobacteraceae bacterium]
MPVVNPTAADPSLFRTTVFATGIPGSNSVVLLSDGSILANTSPQFSNGAIVRYTDTNQDGLSDGAGTVLYSSASGPLTQLREAGGHFYVGEFGANRITILAAGASASDPLTAVGSLQFSYPAGWAHPTVGMAVRETPGSPGSYNLVFNVGSQFNSQASTSAVTISGLGLGPIQVNGDSLYMITIDQTGATPTASSLRTVATGIRNVYGMAFHPTTGDLYFADNAIDEDPLGVGTEPPQADELNRILFGDVGSAVYNFGFPNCYIEYRTGSEIGPCVGVTQPLAVFQPVPNTPDGFRTEGPTEIAFAPPGFPISLTSGLFIGFSGANGVGPANDQNGLVFYNFSDGSYVHFIESGTAGVGNLLGVYTTQDSLFVSDWGSGDLYLITSAVPEPATLGVGAGTLLVMLGLGVRRRFGAVSQKGTGRA